MPKSRIQAVPVLMGLLLGSLLAAGVSAQEPAAPSSYIEAVEEPADAGGVMDEVDAEQAQVEAVQAQLRARLVGEHRRLEAVGR